MIFEVTRNITFGALNDMLLKQNMRIYVMSQNMNDNTTLFIYFYASDTHNLDHMHPYQLLVAVAKKKRKTVLGGKRSWAGDNLGILVMSE